MARRLVDQGVPGARRGVETGGREFTATPGMVWERDGKYYKVDPDGRSYSDISAEEYEASGRKWTSRGGWGALGRIGRAWQQMPTWQKITTAGAAIVPGTQLGAVAQLGMAAAQVEEEPTRVEGQREVKIDKDEYYVTIANATGLTKDQVKDIQKKLDPNFKLTPSVAGIQSQYKDAAAAMEQGIDISDTNWFITFKKRYEEGAYDFTEATYKPSFYKTPDEIAADEATELDQLIDDLAAEAFPDDAQAQLVYKLNFSETLDPNAAYSAAMKLRDPSYLSPDEQFQRDMQMAQLYQQPEMWLQRYRAEHGELPATPGWLDPFVSAARGEQITGAELPEAVQWGELAQLSPQRRAQLEGMFKFMGQPFEEYEKKARETAWEEYEPADLVKRTGAWGTWGWR